MHYYSNLSINLCTKTYKFNFPKLLNCLRF
uniref:Uncharacterized protein n=1 Tax=Rhizophora mucronata TaxID=61149 RepID=A0A2P2QGV5_RHIMU